MRIPFAIHRRVPIIRKILEARDRALAEANSLRNEIDKVNAKLLNINQYLEIHKLGNLDSVSSAIKIPSRERKKYSISPSNSALISDGYREKFREALFKTSYYWVPEDARNSESVSADIDAHVERRFRFFDGNIVPWVSSVADLSQMTVIEIGSGTGSSTLAFAPHVKRVICHEIDNLSSSAARARLDYFGIDNVEIRNELFGPDSNIAVKREPVHLVMLCAVLEHMHFDELHSALVTAWDLLQPGGLLVVADTPNRLALFDEHTSLLPFFSTLPPDLRTRYAAHSPRPDFAESMARKTGNEQIDTLTRWGSGISYHEFELALGHDIHDHIVLDGYETEILDLMPDQIDDIVLRAAFHYYRIPAHLAFTRHNLYFVLRK
ncbi:class I SAM-dependent methyltransferase [Burkholderia ubonensis]|uniref:class I SAM-dependent methyltransferase n=1 Tax=Burkholderia ubonensis TaxID=101571 RepID=UPI0009B33CBA|nr:class I SAM-dependent methyltransferase [Burkholderia ubonensis]